MTPSTELDSEILQDPLLRHDYERYRKLDGPVAALDDNHRGGNVSDDALDANQDLGGGSGVDLFDPGFFGVAEADWPIADSDPEGGNPVSRDLGPELDHAEAHYLPFTRKKEGREALRKVTVEDFDSREERIAFLAIEKHKVDLFGHKAKAQDKRAAVRWFFCREDHGGVTFELCCEVLDSRADVVRLRIHYEFWLRWMVFEEEFPFMTIPLPSIIQGEIMYHVGDEGIELAQEAWLQPGLGSEELLLKASGVDSIKAVPASYAKALEQLEEKYVLSNQHDAWYLTGRNPLLRRLDLEKEVGRNMAIGSSMHWSRLFMWPRHGAKNRD